MIESGTVKTVPYGETGERLVVCEYVNTYLVEPVTFSRNAV